MAVPGYNAIDTTFNLDCGPLLRDGVGVGLADPTPPDSEIFSQDKVIGQQNILPRPVHNRAHNASDGENTMTGHIGGLVILLEKVVAYDILRVWCPAHQIDLVVKDVTKTANCGLFYKVAHAFSVHLRSQLNLIWDMGGSKCPKDTTRWVAFGKIIAWFLQHHCRLLKYVEEKKPVQSPYPAWWIMCAAVAPLFKSLQLTFSNQGVGDLPAGRRNRSPCL